MILEDLIQKIEEKYPLNLAYNWDNVGLLVGDNKSEISKVLLSLEANEKVIDEAIDKKVDLIITHHPFIFSKMNKIITSDFKGNLIHKLIKNDISIYSMHTNVDIAKDGLNDYFLEKINLKSDEVLENTFENDGLGRIVNLEEELELDKLCTILKKNLNIQNLRITGNNKVKRLAVVTGSGGDLVSLAKNKSIDTLITGDVKYHDAQNAIDMNINLIDCNHFESEEIFKDLMERFLGNFKNLEIIKSNVNINPFRIM